MQVKLVGSLMLIACWGSISSDARLLKIRGESLALQGGDEADQQYATAVDGIDGVPPSL